MEKKITKKIQPNHNLQQSYIALWVYPKYTYVRMPIGLLLGEVMITEFMRCSFILFVAVVTVSDGEHIGTLPHPVGFE